MHTRTRTPLRRRTLATAATLTLALGAGLVTMSAGAADWHTQALTMCTVDGAASCSAPAYAFDRPMSVYEPTCNGPTCGEGVRPRREQLIVILHGHPGPAPTSFGEFQQFAANLGYHSISLDFDYGADTNGVPSDGNAPRHICGCYGGTEADNCYGELHEMTWSGTNHAGIPESRYPLERRVVNVVRYLEHTRPGQGWGQFLTSGGDVAYDKLVLAGLSRGTSLATYVAKHHAVSRVIVVGGDHDQLTDGAATSGMDAQHPTTYHYGDANHLHACTPRAESPYYVKDNHFAAGGSAWATPLSAFYAFSGEDDTAAPYFNAQYHFGTLVNLRTLGLETYGGGHRTVGNAQTGEKPGWDSVNSHFLTPGTQGGPGNLCGGGASAHTDGMVGSCPVNGALRNKIWTYMLTH